MTRSADLGSDVTTRSGGPGPIRAGGCSIVTFTPRMQQLRFNAMDRLALHRWETRNAARFRVVIHGRLPGDVPELEEFVSIYPVGRVWAAWCTVRQGPTVTVWRCKDGEDLGRFATMEEALAALPQLPETEQVPCYGSAGGAAMPYLRLLPAVAGDAR